MIHLGDDRFAADLVVSPTQSFKAANLLQKRMSQYLVNEEAAWLLRETEVNLVIDVGANVGQFATSLRGAGYTGRIASFEPVGEPFRRWRRASRDDPEWQVHQCALGDKDGQATINARPGTDQLDATLSEFGENWSAKLRETSAETIQVRRLDSMFDELTAGLEQPVRAYLKMDTQGFDLQVFEGATGVLDQFVAMQSEASCVPIYDDMPRLPEQMLTYEKLGFETVGMFAVSRDRPTMRVIEFDLVMVRPERLRRNRA